MWLMLPASVSRDFRLTPAGCGYRLESGKLAASPTFAGIDQQNVRKKTNFSSFVSWMAPTVESSAQGWVAGALWQVESRHDLFTDQGSNDSSTLMAPVGETIVWGHGRLTSIEFVCREAQGLVHRNRVSAPTTLKIQGPDFRLFGNRTQVPEN